MGILISLFASLGVSQRFAKVLAIGVPIVLAALFVAFLWARGTHYKDQRDTARAQVEAVNARLSVSNSSIALLQSKIADMNAVTDKQAAEYATAQKQASTDRQKLSEQAKGSDALIGRLRARAAQSGGACVPVVPDDLKREAKGL